MRSHSSRLHMRHVLTHRHTLSDVGDGVLECGMSENHVASSNASSADDFSSRLISYTYSEKVMCNADGSTVSPSRGRRRLSTTVSVYPPIAEPRPVSVTYH